MKIILVRHGQTNENAAHRHQPDHTPLSILGRQQAMAVGDKLADRQLTHVVSSPLVRALQTASLIASKSDLIPSIDHDLHELARHRSMTGHGHYSLRSLLFYKFWFLGLTRSGESYRALRLRAARVRAHLELLPDDAVVAVVSHTVFLNLFVVHLTRTRSLWPWQAAAVFLRLIKMPNTGTIELTCNDGVWRRVKSNQ